MQFYYTINTKFVIICEKKRGDVCMKIDWRLFDGEEIVIEELNKDVEFIDNTIYYIDEYGTHVVDLQNKIYERRSPEDIFRVDFNNNILTVKSASNDLKYNINTNYFEEDNIIRLTYSLGEEKKVIEITRKEEL